MSAAIENKINSGFEILRDVGHPWDGRKGFDRMEIKACTLQELNRAIEKAKLRFWHVWVDGEFENGESIAILYKPSGITYEWADSLKAPYQARGITQEVPM